MLAAYDERGQEISPAAVAAVAHSLGWQTAPRRAFDSISDLIAHAQTLPRSQEGFVLRFENGLRLKIKGNEYKRIHALICRVTPLALWQAMAAGDDIEALRRDLPEEFWTDFDHIAALLTTSLTALIERIRATAQTVAHLPDKEVGLALHTLDEDVRGFVFPFRRQGDLLTGRYRQALFRAIRPTANALPGYIASHAMNRVLEEAT